MKRARSIDTANPLSYNRRNPSRALLCARSKLLEPLTPKATSNSTPHSRWQRSLDPVILSPSPNFSSRPMPTLLRQDGFDIRMYFDDHDPPHIHAVKAGGQAKIALGSLDTAPSLMMVQGMSAKEAKASLLIVLENQPYLLDKWEEYHG